MTAIGPDAAVLALALGLLFALVCYLITNLSPGGMITPGWLALLIIESPIRLVLLSVVITLSFFVMKLLRRVVILYGKRLFATVVMVAVFLQFTLFVAISNQTDLVGDNRTLGFIIPGLITYQLIRQPIVATLLSITAVTALSYGAILAGIVLFLVPGGAAPNGLIYPGGGVISAGPQAALVLAGSLAIAMIGFVLTVKRVNRSRPLGASVVRSEPRSEELHATGTTSLAPTKGKNIDEALMGQLSERASGGLGFVDMKALGDDLGSTPADVVAGLACLALAGRLSVHAEAGVPGSFFYRYELEPDPVSE